MRRRRSKAAVGVITLAALACVGCSARETPVRLSLAAAQPGGTYHQVASAMKESLESHQTGLAIQIETTNGSADNVQLLENGEAQLGLVFNKSEGHGHVRTVAPLYLATMQIVIRKDRGVTALSGLAGKRIGVGPEGSGTALLAEEMLRDYEVSNATIVHAPFDIIAEQLAPEGELDAAFFLFGVGTRLLANLLEANDELTLLSLGDANKPEDSRVQGIVSRQASLSTAVIPTGAYGSEPGKPVLTLGTWTVLVARDDVAMKDVQILPRSLFAYRVDLVKSETPFLQLREDFDRHLLQFPLHEGAEAYYLRNKPSFLQQNAEVLALILTMLAGLIAAISTVRSMLRKQRKQRIHHLLEDLDEILGRLEELEESEHEAEVSRLRDRLRALRHAAYRSLVAGQLVPDASFLVVMNYLDYVHSSADRKLKKDRIDHYYIEIVNLRRRLEEGAAASEILDEVAAVRENAMQKLVEEKLEADTSFQIFIHQLETLQKLARTHDDGV